jgi:two-component system chemotaxis sensor kinase CheA
MDMSQYKEEFVSEARDHLDNLNENLLGLEKEPENPDFINKIFRSFHTLKGNAATMGFISFSELAHSLEDVLTKVRDKELKASEEVMDLVLEGCDALEGGLEKISEGNPEEMQAEGLIKELKDLVGKKDEEINVNISEELSLTDEEKNKVNELKSQGQNVHRTIIFFDQGNVLKTAKALVVLRNLAEEGAIIKTTPDNNELKKGLFDSEIEIVFANKLSKQEAEEAINKVSGLKKVLLLEPEEKYERPEEMEHHDKESQKSKIVSKHKSEVVKQVQSVKVDMKKLDKLMNLAGELLISNIRLQEIDRKRDYNTLKSVLSGVDRLILDLQDEVMEIRMVPIGNIFNRFPRMIRDLAKKENKKVNLTIQGETIEFDRTVLDQIGDPLVHLLRNSVDHGIETPEKRINVGKSEEGSLKLIARREKNHAIIEVSDDGDGIDPEKVKNSCIKKGLITEQEAENMSDDELRLLIFRAGASTNEVVTEVSGRGVGMDVAMNKVKELGGTIDLKSEVGKGTTVTLKLPLTLAIITALLVKIEEEIYSIPLTSVDSTVDVQREQIKTVHGHEVFILRGTEVPVLWLSNLMGKQADKSKEKYTLVIVNKNSKPIGLVVDQIVSQQQVLIKSLQESLKGTKGVAGATILGDGSVSLILDIDTLLSK